ncbi:MAG: hypothetical protein KDC12_12815, partial [Flavobacteriales bacterium]|nr:hypothetical protein [Flavobacteriales bacterium]
DYNQGAAVVLVHDTLAFIGAMDSGVITLDISYESQPVFVSHILPFVDFPEPPGLFSVPNARGLDYRDHILFVCYDAGGLRAIDMTDPYNPEEVGMYVNEGIESTAQSAYNNCKVLGDLCFVPVDYCGLDIVEVTDVENMTNYNWYNPWNCLPDNWDGRDGHSNQLVILPSQNLLFMSGADSELLVYDISSPDEEHLVGQYVNLGDNIACWGVDVWNNAVVLSYVNNPLGIPYDSNVGGIQILEWSTEGQSVRETDPLSAMRVFPVPASHYVTIVVNDMLVGEFLTILDGSGREMGQIAVTGTTLRMDVSSLPTGTYDMVSSLGHHRRLVVRQP